LITNDFALIVKAHQLNLEVFELTEEYQTKTDENSDKKKIKKLEAELLELKNKIPKLQILFSNDKQILKCKTMSEKNLNDKEIEEEMLMLREEYPKIVIPPSPTLPQVSLKDALIFGGESSFEIILPTGEKRKISPNQARKYNEELNEFYPKLRTYLNEKVKVDKLRIRTFICDIKINNDGTFPAEDIDVFLSFPDFVKLVSEDDRFSYPEIPEPPEFPEHFNAFNYPKNLFRGSSSYVSPISLKNFSQPKIPSWNQKITQKKEGDTANLWIRNLKHGHTKNFERFCVIFSKPENIKSFQILYKITAANLPKQLEGKLNIVVENKKRHSK
jgi:hypothetical protein